MKKQIIKIASLTALATLITACGTTPKIALPTAPITNIPALSTWSDDKANSENLQILVTSTKHKSDLFVSNVENIINTSGSETVDRNLAKGLQKEIEFAQQNAGAKAKPYTGEQVADFVIIADVTSVGWSSEYEPARSWTDKDGKSHTSAPYCSYKASAKGTLTIRSLPSMERVSYQQLEGSDISTQDNPASRSCDVKSYALGAMNSAVNDLMVQGTDEYQNLVKFVGAQGNIVGARTAEGRTYFETTLGRTKGAKAKLDVKIYQLIDGDLIEIAEGELLDDKNVLQKRSFVYVDEDVVPAIKKGMIVKASGGCEGMFGCLDTIVKDAKTGLGNL
ncbi:hypothetical protein [Thalassotalea maritima]|uniref:hypothetical protein n=1 Tax=Thalassotalea maritima TaxID=3242416 RepID=UPI00352763BF